VVVEVEVRTLLLVGGSKGVKLNGLRTIGK